MFENHRVRTVHWLIMGYIGLLKHSTLSTKWYSELCYSKFYPVLEIRLSWLWHRRIVDGNHSVPPSQNDCIVELTLFFFNLICGKLFVSYWGHLVVYGDQNYWSSRNHFEFPLPRYWYQDVPFPVLLAPSPNICFVLCSSSIENE